MAKVDLHVHSKYSDSPSEWFLQKLKVAESYTTPEFIYKTAKDRGMDFVTITDHNRIDGAFILKEKYPQEVFTGVEVTTQFPEDGCQVHILIYGLTEFEFKEILRFRKDIYLLRAYIKQRNLAYSVAHPSFSVNGKLSLNHLEKLILLFNIFEGINGGRNRINNNTWTDVLKNLTPAYLEELYSKHRIEPFDDKSWIKGVTGGSDDHGGIFIGKTYTVAMVETIDDFLKNLKEKNTFPQGRHSDYQSLAFTIYKIACDFAKNKSERVSKTFLNHITQTFFEKKSLNLINKIKVKKLKLMNRKNRNSIDTAFLDLIESLNDRKIRTIEERLEIFYDKIASISDAFFEIFITSLEHDIKKGDIVSLVKNISSSVFGIFLSIPFLATFKHMHNNRDLLEELILRFKPFRPKGEKKILWFTDSLNDLNGISVILKKIGWLSSIKGRNLKIVTSLLDEEINQELPPNVLPLPFIYSFNLPYYEKYILKIPSILRSLKEIYQFELDEIYISTPGPLGLFGLLMAKFLNVKSIGVYHTDFTLQANEIIEDESVAPLIETYTKRFYSSMDEIMVPTIEYMNVLENRGFDRGKMKIFKTGTDVNLFSPKENGKIFLRDRFNIKKGINLLFVGRISRDKNLDFLLQIYVQVLRKVAALNLLIVGDGPYLLKLREKVNKFKRVILTGRLEQKELSRVYSGADLFVFPSITDTFGVAVLEAQSCGLPAIVSDRGGPREIIIDGKTGFVAKADEIKDWEEKIRYVINLIKYNHKVYIAMRKEARKNVMSKARWEIALKDLLGQNWIEDNLKTHNLDSNPCIGIARLISV
jgi:glycosyltransferase involved in cell wall biosynthesis